MASTDTGLKRRKPNWTQDECVLLATLILEKKHILRGKLSPMLTSRMKKDAWEDVTKKLNASAVTPRSSEEVEKKWHNIFSNAKSEISSFRRATTGTGGGPPSKPLSVLAESVQRVIGESNEIIEGVQGGMDSSLLQLFPAEDSPNICSIQLPLLPTVTPLSPQLLSDHTCTPNGDSVVQLLEPTCSLNATSALSFSPLPPLVRSRTQRHVIPSTVPTPTKSSNQQMIEELTIQKLKLEIEYYTLKVNAAKRKLEE